ncbi:hypothetical protein [Hymenobacter glacialis]|uniref:Outer membrane protein beta-barrel domain-containing protein n=1 Tax=Hymenobacter glacialis TaxID=1908236 RepID=A0A1G1T756_9BACT|nr:hypothetical protein [Hymenobacter glacialis]OGX86710.1 hypothetical protein BEN48_12295 [Hymenobacter glacialis]
MKRFFLLAVLLLPGVAAHAATPPDTSAAAVPPAPRKWWRPAHLLLQTGGGLGQVAAGAGYALAKNRLETDVLFGYVPRKYAGSTLSLASLKVMYSPFRLQVAPKVQVLPLTVGAYASYTHGIANDGVRGQYPKDYYWFSVDTRVGPLLGGRVTYLAPPLAATGQPRRVSAYYELGTNDLYIASFFGNLNGGLGFGKILTLALGVKADF